MIVGIVGSRTRNDSNDLRIVNRIIENLYQQFGKDLVIVSGDCKTGADYFAQVYCKQAQIPMVEFPAKLTNKVPLPVAIQAYYARNKSIATISDRLYALVTLDRTGGTENTIKHAHALGTSVRLVGPTGYVRRDAKPQVEGQSTLPLLPRDTGSGRVVKGGYGGHSDDDDIDTPSPFDNPYRRD